jgi:hypothetical protein
MAFVYLHIIWFGCWIGFGVEDYPFGLLTMGVSLEAIVLSTFVKELLDLSRQILDLTKEVRSATASPARPLRRS